MRPICLAAALLFFPLSAFAQPLVQSQEGIALQNEIDQLQSQVQQLQNNGGSALGGNSAPAQAPTQAPASSAAAPDNGMVANLLTQVQQLQGQVQTLNGEVDTLQNQLNQQNAQTQKEIGDINFKLTGSATPGAPPLAPGAAPNAGQAPAFPAPASPALPPALPPESSSADPKAQLHEALAAYEKHDYASAAALAQALVQAHKGAPESYRAQYLVAQSLAGQGQAQNAAIAYDDTYNMNRTGAYAPQSLYGLAYSLAAIGQNEAACDTLSSLNSQFPTPPAGLGPRIAALSKKASCQ